MRVIGIRELRQHASRYLRLVARGETVQIADRGVPVALLTPIADSTPLDALIQAGLASAVDEDLLELGPPLRPRKRTEPASEFLDRARRDER